MKIAALREFNDKETGKVYSRGDVISHFSDERVATAISLGLAMVLNEEKGKGNTDVSGQSGKTDTTQKEKTEKDLTAKVEETGQTVNTDTSGQPVKSDVDATVTDIDMSLQWQKVIALIKVFGDVEKLKGYLAAENLAEKPRVSVVAALESRISELSKNEE